MSRLNSLRAVVTSIALSSVLLGALSKTAAADQKTAPEAGQPVAAEESRPEAALAGEFKELRQEVEAMRRDLRDVRSVLKRIEERIGKEEAPSEFSPVTIRVQSEDGRPLEGFLVKMESARQEGQRAFASGRSDRTGLALSRQLPYGDYHISVSEDSGWSTSFRSVTVEIGTAFERVVVAPDPRERASLTMHAALRPDVFDGLRFGERREPAGGRAYSVEHSPEPGAENARLASFPTVGDGIREPGFEVRIGVERKIEQPGDEEQTWRWSGGRNHVRTLLVTENGIAGIKEVASKTARPEDSARYFARAEGRSDFFTVGYIKLELQEPDHPGVSLEITSGDATLQIARVLGRAEDSVLPSLGLEKAPRPGWKPVSAASRSGCRGSSTWTGGNGGMASRFLQRRRSISSPEQAWR